MVHQFPEMAMEICSLFLGLSLIAFSLALNEHGCEAVCLSTGVIYGVLMCVSCVVVLYLHRFMNPLENNPRLIGMNRFVDFARWVLTALITFAILFMHMTSLDSSSLLQTSCWCCLALCGLYLLMLPALKFLIVGTAHPEASSQSEDRGLHGAQMDRSLRTQAEQQPMIQRVCCICCENPANAMCLPCRHASTCEYCLFMLKKSNGKCPVCRADIENFVATGDGAFINTFVASRASGACHEITASTSPLLDRILHACCPSLFPSMQYLLLPPNTAI